MTAYSSTQNGPWHDPATWGGSGPPGDNDTATILHNVYIDSNITIGTGTNGSTQYAITIENSGILRWANPPSGNYTLTLRGGIYVKKGGKFQIGTSSTPLDSGFTATIYFSATSSSSAWRIFVASGELHLFGAPSYHMADSAKWRAKLTTDISPGTGVSFSVDRAVDWQVGDIISVGIGGKKDEAINETTMVQERVTILSKTSSDTFTADFAYSHRAGSHVAHHTRNILIYGNTSVSGAGFQIALSRTDTDNSISTRCFLSWVRFLHGGWSSTTYLLDVNIAATGKLTPYEDFLLFDHVVFDESCYSTTTNFGPGVSFAFSGVPLANESCVADVIFYRFGDCIRFADSTLLRVDRLVGIGIRQLLQTSTSIYPVVVGSEFWLDQFKPVSASGSCLGYVGGKFTDFEILACYYIYDTNNYTAPITLKNGNIWHTSAGTSSGLGQLAFVDSVEFYAAMLVTDSVFTTLFVRGCSFDGVATAVNIQSGTARFSGCQFGTVQRNTTHNILVASTAMESRILAENCAFMEPQSWSESNSYFTKTHRFSIWNYLGADWRNRIKFGRNQSAELAACSVLNASLQDQMALDYGTGVQRLFWTTGWDFAQENTEILDGSVKLKGYAFSPGGAAPLNEHRPILIPVSSSGRTVIVKLSVKKNKSGYYLPKIVLHGCGIFAEASATRNVHDTWEELTVSGVTQSAGMCYFLIFAGSDQKTSNSSNANDFFFGPNAAPSWSDIFVYFDKLSIVVN